MNKRLTLVSVVLACQTAVAFGQEAGLNGSWSSNMPLLSAKGPLSHGVWTFWEGRLFTVHGVTSAAGNSIDESGTYSVFGDEIRIHPKKMVIRVGGKKTRPRAASDFVLTCKWIDGDHFSGTIPGLNRPVVFTKAGASGPHLRSGEPSSCATRTGSGMCDGRGSRVCDPSL